jgi:hypothetical protein
MSLLKTYLESKQKKFQFFNFNSYDKNYIKTNCYFKICEKSDDIIELIGQFPIVVDYFVIWNTDNKILVYIETELDLDQLKIFKCINKIDALNKFVKTITPLKMELLMSDISNKQHEWAFFSSNSFKNEIIMHYYNVVTGIR